MKRAFRFRLARVLRVREVFEEQARAELTAALSALAFAEARCAHLRAEIARGQEAQLQSQSGGSLDVRALLARERALEMLDLELGTAHVAEAEARHFADEQRAVWQVRRGESRALEQLAERQKTRHGMEVSRLDNADLDEVASQRFSPREG